MRRRTAAQRERLIDQAKALRADGLAATEIAQRLGVSRSTAFELLRPSGRSDHRKPYKRGGRRACGWPGCRRDRVEGSYFCTPHHEVHARISAKLAREGVDLHG